MGQKLLLQKVERHFSLAKHISFNRGVLGKNSFGDPPQKRSVWNERDSSSMQEVEIIYHDDLDEVS